MEWDVTVSGRQGRLSLELSCQRVGEEVLLCLTGGSSPHIGCAVLASPRPSLSDPGKVSATSSVLNLPGHKDEALCRSLAEAVSAALNRTALCVGGVHVDRITAEELSWFAQQAALLGEQAVQELRALKASP